MSLYIKSAEVAAMADRLATLRKVTKTEAVRQALQHELEREAEKPDLVEVGLAFARALRARGNPELGLPVDKAFIDSLYEDD